MIAVDMARDVPVGGILGRGKQKKRHRNHHHHHHFSFFTGSLSFSPENKDGRSDFPLEMMEFRRQSIMKMADFPSPAVGRNLNF